MKKLLLAVFLITASSAKLQSAQLDSIIVGALCGPVYEQIVYHKPASRSILGVLGTFCAQILFLAYVKTHTLPVDEACVMQKKGEHVQYFKNAIIQSYGASLVTALGSYLLEKDEIASKKEEAVNIATKETGNI